MNGRVLVPVAFAMTLSVGSALADSERGRRLLEANRPDEAAAAFEDPAWRGVAFYRAGRLRAAADAFRQAGDPRSLYNLGNALARLDDYEGALKAYDAALVLAPDNEDARANRQLVARLIDTSGARRVSGGGADSDASRNVGDRDAADEDEGTRSGLGDGAAGQRGTPSASPTQGRNPAPQRAAIQQPQPEEAGAAKGSAADSEGAGRTGEGAAPESRSGAGAAPPEQQQEGWQATEQWLAAIPDDPGRYLRARIAFEHARRVAAGVAVPPGANPW